MRACGQDVRNQVVAAAMKLFRRKGFHATTTQEIITAAGCSKGGFYYHFPSKESLLYLAHDTFIDFELGCARRVAEGPGSAQEKLTAIMTDLVESIARYQAEVTVFFQERHMLSSDKYALVKQKRDEYEAIVQRLVKDGVACGEFRADIDPELVTLALFGMCNWTYQWYRPDGPLSPGDIGQRFATLLMDGLRRTPARGRTSGGSAISAS